ncbi:hypothetical protein [Azorhizobium sp. AG788]|uniref:hypothetical protein n=1 Tax=Azorhizobium sp. AG788 TaxID=2183897 RepID=UPI003138883D
MGERPAPNSDRLALIAQADLDRLVRRVIAPALRELAPSDHARPTGELDEEAFFALAEAETHNALCQEARRAFALTIGAAFERHLRLWLAHTALDRRAEVESARFDQILILVREIKHVDVDALPIVNDLRELWELVSALRHGDGHAANRLLLRAPNLWEHETPEQRVDLSKNARLVSALQVHTADLDRYIRAIMIFWGEVGATPPWGGSNSSPAQPPE